MIRTNKDIVATICVVLISIGFLINSDVFEALFPNARNNYDIWTKYVDWRNKAYEVMFLIAFIFFAINGNLLTKSISIGMIFVIFGSILDKLFYNRNYYHIFDGILTSIAILVGGCIYIKEKCKK
jgi:hypothetical protein